MLPTVTINKLAEKWLDPKVTQAIQNVDLVSTLEAADTKSIDDLSRKYLSPQVIQALPKVDLSNDWFEAKFQVKAMESEIKIRGLSPIILVLTLAAILLGSGPLLALLKALFGN